MRPVSIRLSPALLVVLSAAVLCSTGCEGCSCSRLTKRYLGTAPEDDVTKEVERQLRSSPQIAREMCGIPAKGLVVEEQTVESTNWGIARVKIEARPILEPSGEGGAGGGASRDGEGGSALDAKKMLLCTGIVLLGFEIVLDDADEMQSIDFDEVTTSSVDTPGVSFEPPSIDWD